ncbi:hypothetical protein TNCV_2264971 [Trichonephila clavipes]|nr:hypothetical protein TNCV_2264971 [Trichonephila clavipes]
MSRSGGQFKARPPLFKSPSKLRAHLSTHCSRDKKAESTLPSPGIEPGSVMWKRMDRQPMTSLEVLRVIDRPCVGGPRPQEVLRRPWWW